MGWNVGSWGHQSGWQQPTPTTSPATQGMQQALDVATGWAGPSLIQNDINADRLANQLGYGDAQYGLGVDALQQNTALDRARLGINARDINIDRESIARQMGVSNQLQALANQLFGIDIKGLGIDQRGLDAQMTTANRNLDAELRRQMSDATARGAVGGPGLMYRKQETEADRQDAFGNFLRSTEQLGLRKDQVGIARKQSDINYTEDRAKLADRAKILDNQAGKLGIDAKQLEANLSQGLARLGVDRLFNMNDLLDAMASNDVDRQAIAQQIFREAMGMSQFFTDQLAPPTAPTGARGGTGFNGGSAGSGGGAGSGGSSW